MSQETQYSATVGIDWADKEHVISIKDHATGKIRTFSIKQSPVAILEWVSKLRKLYNSGQVAVGLEQSRGALIYALAQYDLFVLFPVNPVAMAAFRKSMSVSGAKDDPSDANLIRIMVEKHYEKLRPWQPADEATRRVMLLSEKRRRTVNIRTRISNSLKALLKEYYPQAIELAGQKLHVPLGCDLISKWPSFQQLKKAKASTIRTFYYAHNSRSEKCIKERLDLIDKEIPLTNDPAIVDSSIIMALALIGQLRQLTKAIKQFDAAIIEQHKLHPDHAIFDSFPGAGDFLAPRLLAVFGSDRERWNNASDIQKFSGIAPVTKRSGQSCSIHRRYACPKFILQTFHEYAAISLQFSVWAKAYYDRQKDKGKGHHAVVRSLAFKWIRIIFRCWKDKTMYNEVKYLQALQKAGSPLLAQLSKAA